MPAEAKVKITVQAGKEQVEDNLLIPVDSAVAVTDQMVCANGDAWIEVFAGKRESICFLLLKTDPREVQPSAGCPMKETEYVQFCFTEAENDTDLNMKSLKGIAYITPELCDEHLLPPMVNYLYIKNPLTKDVKISVLAGRKKPANNGDMNKPFEPAERVSMAARKPR